MYVFGDSIISYSLFPMYSSVLYVLYGYNETIEIICMYNYIHSCSFYLKIYHVSCLRPVPRYASCRLAPVSSDNIYFFHIPV